MIDLNAKVDQDKKYLRRIIMDKIKLEEEGKKAAREGIEYMIDRECLS